MAPLNIDEEFRNKLKNREITPSDQLWEQLEAALEEPPKRKIAIGWWAVAAMFVLASVWFIGLNQKKQDLVNPTVVEVPKTSKEKRTKNLNKIPIIPSETINKARKEEVVNAGARKKESKNTPKSEKQLKLKDASLLESEMVTVVKEGAHTKEVTQNPIEQKISEIIAVVESQKAKGEQVTDAEIDALLREASMNLRLEQYLKQDTVVVDADALLQEIESDMRKEKMLKDHIYQTLKQGYLKARTSLVSRRY